MSLDQKIIKYLQTVDEPTRTIDIAKNIIGPKATKKDVNPTLYAMERQGLVVKTAKENGGDPRWTLKTNTDDEKLFNTIEQNIKLFP